MLAGITRLADNARRAATLQKELDYLRSLRPDDATTRGLVETRYFLQLEKYKYLTGVENDAFGAFTAATANVSNATRNEGSLNILGVGGGGASLLGAVVALAGKDSLIAPGPGSSVIFTEYELERPSTPENENEEKIFEILPPLFPAKQ